MEALLEIMESAANMLRGMTLDPAIPLHAKVAMSSKIVELEAAVELALENGLWVNVVDSLPDADMTVMTYGEDAEEPIWPTYFDGEQWQDPMGHEIDGSMITHWMPFPDPPVTESV